MSLKRFHTALQIKAVDTTQRIIEGYAAVFGNRDRAGDVIEAGAFDRTLRANKDVLIFIGHDSHSMPLGEPTEMRADKHGLFTKTRIYQTNAGDDLLTVAHERMGAGKSLGMSIGYRVQKDRLSTRGAGVDGLTRHLLDIDLVEYSFLASTDLAANPLAQSTGVKRYARRKPMKVREHNGKWAVVDDDDKVVAGGFSSQEDADAALKLASRSDGDDDGKAWDTAYVNNLPDDAFAYIEEGGHKDEEGKTVPRSLRHYPHHDADGNVDVAHLRYALTQASQTPDTGEKVLPILLRHAAAAGIGKPPPDVDDAHEKVWSDWGAPSQIVVQLHKLDELLTVVLEDQSAMTKLGIDTKTGRKLKGERLTRLKEIIGHLQEVVDWAEAVDRGDDGKSLADFYRIQAETLGLELAEVA